VRDWLSGAETVERLNIRDSKLVEYVQNGLQPFDNRRTEVPPPDVIDHLKTIKDCSADISDIEQKFPQFREKYGTLSWHYAINHNIEGDLTNEYVDVFYHDGSFGPKRVEIEYTEKRALMDRSQAKLDEYLALPKWTGYQLPVSDADQAPVISMLMDLWFKVDDIIELEGAVDPDSTPQTVQNQPQEEATDDAFIRSLQISFVSDSEFSIRVGSKPAKIYTCSDMKLNEGSVLWRLFVEILRSTDHTYHVGVYSRDRDPAKNRNYYKLVARTRSFSKKFISFINTKYHTSLPGGLSVFENQKGFETAGTYKPMFKMASANNVIKNTDMKKMTEEETRNKIITLLKEKKQEKDEKQVAQLLIEIGEYAEYAKSEGWITEKWLRSQMYTYKKDDFDKEDFLQAVPIEDLKGF
jgi:hypothetical protein